MRTILAFSFLILALVILGLTGKAQRRFIGLKPIITDLNNDNILDTISLSSSIADSSLFNKISISISGFSKQTFVAKNAWGNIDKDFLVQSKNAVNSKKLFLLKGEGHSVILLFGFVDGAGYREDFSIINIKDNKPQMVFDKGENDINIEWVVKIGDIDNDGRTDFVFRNSYQTYDYVDSLKSDIGNYSPYFVYTIDNDCKLNERLTKQYNEENYVFAGFKYNDKIKILYPRNKSKPRVYK